MILLILFAHSGWGGYFAWKSAYIVSFIVYFFYHDSYFTVSSCIPHESPHGKTDKTYQQLPLLKQKRKKENNFSPLGGIHLRMMELHTVSYTLFHWTMILKQTLQYDKKS